MDQPEEESPHRGVRAPVGLPESSGLSTRGTADDGPATALAADVEIGLRLPVVPVGVAAVAPAA